MAFGRLVVVIVSVACPYAEPVNKRQMAVVFIHCWHLVTLPPRFGESTFAVFRIRPANVRSTYLANLALKLRRMSRLRRCSIISRATATGFWRNNRFSRSCASNLSSIWFMAVTIILSVMCLIAVSSPCCRASIGHSQTKRSALPTPSVDRNIRFRSGQAEATRIGLGSFVYVTGVSPLARRTRLSGSRRQTLRGAVRLSNCTTVRRNVD